MKNFFKKDINSYYILWENIYYYNNDKCFWFVLFIYMFVKFYSFFLQKIGNNRLKKKSIWLKFRNIIFLFLLKVGSVVPRSQQINFALLSVFLLKLIWDHCYITIIHKSILFNWNVTSSLYLEMLLINMIKLLSLFFSKLLQCLMLLLVTCGGFNSRRFSYSNILIFLSTFS